MSQYLIVQASFRSDGSLDQAVLRKIRPEPVVDATVGADPDQLMQVDEVRQLLATGDQVFVGLRDIATGHYRICDELRATRSQGAAPGTPETLQAFDASGQPSEQLNQVLPIHGDEGWGG